MISHEHKCIFIHIFICAGISIETAFNASIGDHRSMRTLQPLPPMTDLFSSYENSCATFRRLRKKRYRFSVRKPQLGETLTKEQFETYFKFTIVRNPWARAYSYYRWVERRNINRRLYKHPSFDVFLKRFIGKRGLRPQTYWLKDFSGAIPMDFIGRFENLNQDFEQACVLMGREPIALPHKNKGGDGDYREHYNDELHGLIQNAYQEEIALFNYTFDGA